MALYSSSPLKESLPKTACAVVILRIPFLAPAFLPHFFFSHLFGDVITWPKKTLGNGRWSHVHNTWTYSIWHSTYSTRPVNGRLNPCSQCTSLLKGLDGVVSMVSSVDPGQLSFCWPQNFLDLDLRLHSSAGGFGWTFTEWQTVCHIEWNFRAGRVCLSTRRPQIRMWNSLNESFPQRTAGYKRETKDSSVKLDFEA